MPGTHSHELGVLGPTTVRAYGTPVPLRPRERDVLAVLGLIHPLPASVGDIIEALWAHDPPPSAKVSVQNHISRMRHTLGAETIVTDDSGYRLGAGWSLDIEELDARRKQGRRSTLSGDHAAAQVHLDRARSLVRGAAFADLADSQRVLAARAHRREIVASLDEEFVLALLEAGEPRTAAARAAALVEADPDPRRDGPCSPWPDIAMASDVKPCRRWPPVARHCGNLPVSRSDRRSVVSSHSSSTTIRRSTPHRPRRWSVTICRRRPPPAPVSMRSWAGPPSSTRSGSSSRAASTTARPGPTRSSDPRGPAPPGSSDESPCKRPSTDGTSPRSPATPCRSWRWSRSVTSSARSWNGNRTRRRSSSQHFWAIWPACGTGRPGQAESLRRAGDPASASLAWEVVRLADDAGDDESYALAAAALCRLGPLTEAGTLNEELAAVVERAVGRAPTPSIRATVAGEAVLFYSMSGRIDRCSALFDDALHQARLAGDDRLLLGVLGNTYIALTHPDELQHRVAGGGGLAGGPAGRRRPGSRRECGARSRPWTATGHVVERRRSAPRPGRGCCGRTG